MVFRKSCTSIGFRIYTTRSRRGYLTPDTRVTKDFEKVETGIVYELTGMVVFARKPNEKHQQHQQQQHQQRDISKLEGHLVSFIKVKPPYVDAPGCFDVSSPVGMTPGVSPLVFAGKNTTSANKKEKKEEQAIKEATATPLSSRLRSNAVEFGAEKAEPFTPKNMSSKMGGGDGGERLDVGDSLGGSSATGAKERGFYLTISWSLKFPRMKSHSFMDI